MDGDIIFTILRVHLLTDIEGESELQVTVLKVLSYLLCQYRFQGILEISFFNIKAVSTKRKKTYVGRALLIE
jgi:hypothetical protein